MPYTLPQGYVVAEFPLICQYDPSEQWIDNVVIERSKAGDAWGRSFYPTKKKAFEFTAKGLSFQEKSELEAFYDANRDRVIDVRFAIAEAPGTAIGVIRVLFAPVPSISYDPLSQTFDIRFKFEEA